MDHNNHWYITNADKVEFGYDSASCSTKICTKITASGGIGSSIDRCTNITNFSSIQLRFDLGTNELEPPDRCRVYYAYASRDNKVELQSYGTVTDDRHYFLHQEIDLPLSPQSNILCIFFEVYTGDSSHLDICYWDNVALIGTLSTNPPSSIPSSSVAPTFTASYITTTTNTTFAYKRLSQLEEIMILLAMILVICTCICVVLCFVNYGRYQSQPYQNIEFEANPSEENVVNDVVNAQEANVGRQELLLWLVNVVKLPFYYDAFIFNGFESLRLVGHIESKMDLYNIGIVDTLHQNRIMNCIDILKYGEHHIVFQIKIEKDRQNKAMMMSWLADVVKLPMYYELFISNGYESLDFIKEIKDELELNDIGIVDVVHQHQLMDCVNKLKTDELRAFFKNRVDDWDITKQKVALPNKGIDYKIQNDHEQ